ncbi:MAG TPA: phosphoribosyltransferase [Pseudonocardiaceae bacterium]|jgi:predicted phosphoribosyltransferase|nr:phosphoribosyltransferase [Pseudonocardiaceae bacterium]
MAERVFRDRADAGRALAGLLGCYRDRPDVIALGLPRGGVPVAREVATALGAELDVFLVRKLGLPEYPELAMGAIASGGMVVLNDDVVHCYGVSARTVWDVMAREERELRRRERDYRGHRSMADVTGRTVIIVDDGLATGATMRAAIAALRPCRPARLVVAVPAASESACDRLRREADDVVCGATPDRFFAVGSVYQDFTQTTDDQVRDLLGSAADRAVWMA